MKLFGNFLSPYTRRIAVTLNQLEIPYEMETFRVMEEPEKARANNPLGRIPALQTDEGETLIESYAILDAIDEIAGPERALTPPKGPERRRVLKITAVATGTMDKGVWAYYETRTHPPEKVHEPWIEHNDKQVLGGLAFLEDLAVKAEDKGSLAGGTEITQADVSTAVAFAFIDKVRPNLNVRTDFPALNAFSEDREGLDAFKKAPIPT